MANELKMLEEAYNEALLELQTMQKSGVTQKDENYLEFAQKRYALALLKRDIELMELEENLDTPEVSVIKEKMIELEALRARNVFEESCYRWALAQVEKVCPNSMLDVAVPELVQEMFDTLLSIGVVLSVKEGSSTTKNTIKKLMLQKGVDAGNIGRDIEALNIALANKSRVR